MAKSKVSITRTSPSPEYEQIFAAVEKAILQRAAVEEHQHESPGELVEMLVAARRAGDEEQVERVKGELQERFGVSLLFASELRQRKGVEHE